jgi:hypothetical protein
MADLRKRARSRPAVVPGARPWNATPRSIATTFRRLLDEGVELTPAGEAAEDPARLLEKDYLPRYAVSLFDATYFLANFRHDDDLDYFVGYVLLDPGEKQPAAGRKRRIHPRIFYKDSSLVFRVATHVVRTGDENWIGKGDLKLEHTDEGEMLCSAEETTNLPLEVQAAFDVCTRRGPHGLRDEEAPALLLRAGPEDRMRPYADFSTPRRKAMLEHRINGGRRIARFTRRGDPTSLRFTPGFEPDFKRGVIETSRSASRLYGGKVVKYRILSTNSRIQYAFVATPRHVWINPPQALTQELSTYGVRTIDVMADEELFVPGYEYHYLDEWEDPPAWVSQIPRGFAGEANPDYPERADASPWIEAMPVIRRFRKEVLGR